MNLHSSVLREYYRTMMYIHTVYHRLMYLLSVCGKPAKPRHLLHVRGVFQDAWSGRVDQHIRCLVYLKVNSRNLKHTSRHLNCTNHILNPR